MVTYRVGEALPQRGLAVVKRRGSMAATKTPAGGGVGGGVQHQAVRTGVEVASTAIKHVANVTGLAVCQSYATMFSWAKGKTCAKLGLTSKTRSHTLSARRMARPAAGSWVQHCRHVVIATGTVDVRSGQFGHKELVLNCVQHIVEPAPSSQEDTISIAQTVNRRPSGCTAITTHPR